MMFSILLNAILCAPISDETDLYEEYYSSPYKVEYGTPENPIKMLLTVPAKPSPPGANLDDCKSDKPPVVLVHGTFENQNNNWGTLSPLLANSGRCVYTLNFGAPKGAENVGTFMGVSEITNSSKELGAFVDDLLQRTGAQKIDLVGHSQGAMMPHLWIRDLGGASKVNKFVMISPSNNGTTFSGLQAIAPVDLIKFFCEACTQQLKGSDFMESLHQKPLVQPGIQYTVIATQHDEVVTPFETQFLSGENVKNILLQDGCSKNRVGHLGIVFDKRALGFVVNEINDSDNRVVCKKTRATEILKK